MIAFNAVIRIRGVNPFILVSRARVRSLRPNWRKPIPVIVRINRLAVPGWHVNLMPVGDGSFFLYLHGRMRASTRTAVGDRVRVEIEFDPAYRGGPQQPAPRWFMDALKSHPMASGSWRALPPSRKKELVRYLAGLKSAPARSRNLARALHVLSGGHGRFLGREWHHGS